MLALKKGNLFFGKGGDSCADISIGIYHCILAVFYRTTNINDFY
jgi:hypothetical protein